MARSCPGRLCHTEHLGSLVCTDNYRRFHARKKRPQNGKTLLDQSLEASGANTVNYGQVRAVSRTWHHCCWTDTPPSQAVPQDGDAGRNQSLMTAKLYPVQRRIVDLAYRLAP